MRQSIFYASFNMMYVQTVALKEVKFFAFHGLYPEEQLTGNHFLVDVEVKFFPDATADTENIAHTVNYEVINELVRQEMEQTQKLLETVVKNIMDALLKLYPFLVSADIGIKKLNPPMKGIVGHSFVQLSYIAP